VSVRPLEPSAPLARQLAPQLEEAICACRRETGWEPRLVAGATGFAHSTVWKVLKRAGISRPPKPTKEPANRYEWPCPGDLLHMDTSRYARFLRPGHRVTGDRSQRSRNWMRPETRVGYDYAHAIVDDHSRLAYVELHDNEKAATVTAFLERALAFFAEHGIVAKRLMTDNGFSYVKNRSLRELLAREGIRRLTTHKLTYPRTTKCRLTRQQNCLICRIVISRRADSNRGPLHYEGRTSEERASTRGNARARSRWKTRSSSAHPADASARSCPS